MRAAKGTTRHYVGNSLIEHPVFVEIEQDGGLFFVLRLDAQGQCLADTCHHSLEEAKAQAEFEYVLQAEGWEEV